MRSFDQKPRFASRPFEWFVTLGRGTEAMTKRFLQQLQQQLDESGDDPFRLVSLREEFLLLLAHDAAMPVIQQRVHAGGPLYRAVSIWLLSKSASRFNLLGIDRYCDDPSPLVRKHVAKALSRLEAWDVLKEMARQHLDDEAVLRFVEPAPNRKNFDDRLADYANNTPRESAAPVTGPSRMPLWFRDEYWSGSAPKSVVYIRAILRHIHALVHG